MPLTNPIILTSSKASFQITALTTAGAIVPPILTFTVGTGGAAVGATSIPVAITAPTGVTLSSTNIVNGTYFFANVATTANKQVISVSGDQFASVTNLTVDPLTNPLSVGDVFTGYAGCLPLIGLEAANWQLQKTANTIVLLASGGWETSSYGTGSSQFSGTLHIPSAVTLAGGQRTTYQALFNQQYLFVERFLSNGDYVNAVAIVTDLSDTVQGTAFVSVNTTFKVSGYPNYQYLGGIIE